jgi:hypothetical protein
MSFSPKDVTQTQRDFNCSLSNLKSVEMYSDFLLFFTCSLARWHGSMYINLLKGDSWNVIVERYIVLSGILLT